MGVARQIIDLMEKYPWVARIPAEGKADGKFLDLSTSSPARTPDESVRKAFVDAVSGEPPGAHRYMSNAGYMETRRAVSKHLAESAGINAPPELIIMTYGSSGGLNVALKAILDPGSEVILVSPHPFEYPIFAWNHGGQPVVVGSNGDFSLNPGRIAAAVDIETRAVMISCPNDPTGAVYSADSMKELAALLDERQKHFKNTTYILWDQRYRRITHDGACPVDIFKHYENSVVIGSFSKDLGIGGERSGYIAINPACPHKKKLFAAMAMVVRTLGFVNSPALVQRAIARIEPGDGMVPSFTAARDFLCGELEKHGYEFRKPEGGYFVFVKSPGGDDGFVEKLKENGVLVVPGGAFGAPGNFRVSFCVKEETIRKAAVVFRKLSPKRT